MRLVIGAAERGPVVSSAAVIGALAMLTFAVFTNLPLLKVAPLIVVMAVAAAAHRRVLAWPTLLGLVILVILLIPIRRYAMPGNLPFDLEPYRLAVALVAAAWVSSLLVDPRVRLRRSSLEKPFFVLLLVVLSSVIANGDQIQELGVGAIVAKDLTFLASFFIVFYLIISLVRRPEHVDMLVRTLVVGGALIALLALVEARTGNNAFNGLDDFVPLLEQTEEPSDTDLKRFGRVRAYASAQHPIALGAALALILPLAVYLAQRTGRKRWWLAGSLLGLGALATLSRTSVLMLGVIAVVFFRHRPKEMKRLWPLLLPAALVVHFALPGTIGAFQGLFFPEEGLIAEQQKAAGSVGSGRVADLGPSLGEWKLKPLLGYGYGTRIVEGQHANAFILDDQWLGILLETGLLGALAWLWLLARFIRKTGRKAKEDPSPHGWLLTAITASVSAFAWGMLTFDAFSFIQATFLLFILLGLGCAAVSGAWPRTRERRLGW
jgi:O-antigen ligase/polysaccharide polymerase Wzy-like membrane protein